MTDHKQRWIHADLKTSLKKSPFQRLKQQLLKKQQRKALVF